jgi:hypothetical protein
VKQRWHGNLQQDARALVILLRVGCVEPDTRDVTFGGIFESLNNDQYSCCLRPIKGNRGHQSWLEGPLISLSKADRADYIAVIFRRTSSSYSWSRIHFIILFNLFLDSSLMLCV